MKNRPDIDYGFISLGRCPRCGDPTFAEPHEVCFACSEELRKMRAGILDDSRITGAYPTREQVD